MVNFDLSNIFFPFQINTTKTRLTPTKLRLDDQYVLWYSNVARLVVTGIIPFASLTYLNSRIYTVIRRRRRMTNRPRAAPSAAQKAEESRQAIVLLVIVILFLICHTLRIILNVHGLFNLKFVRQSLRNGCSGVTNLWSLIGASISHILLTINSSVNFIIYCFMCTTFRRILYTWVNKFFGCRLPEVQHSDASGHDDNENNPLREDSPGQHPLNEHNGHNGQNGHHGLEGQNGQQEQNGLNQKKIEEIEMQEKKNGGEKFYYEIYFWVYRT